MASLAGKIVSCGLCLCSQIDGEWKVLLIRRSKDLELPKGRLESFDPNMATGALREICEEAGLESSIYIYSFLCKHEYYFKRKKMHKVVFFFLAFPLHRPQHAVADSLASHSAFLFDGSERKDREEEEEEENKASSITLDDFSPPSFGARERSTKELRWVSLSTIESEHFKTADFRDSAERALREAEAMLSGPSPTLIVDEGHSINPELDA